jgi:amino acid permease
MIGIGGTIGVGFESEGGEILAIAGPGGLLVAFVVMGKRALGPYAGPEHLVVVSSV